MCANLWVSLGILLLTASGNACRPPNVGAAASAADFGLSSESTPWPINATDKRGRAILRINMAGGLPGVPGKQTGGRIAPATGGSAGPTTIGWIGCER